METLFLKRDAVNELLNKNINLLFSDCTSESDITTTEKNQE